ncbi:MAG TPA: hypothetical protein VLS93_14760 [Anaeromyxobacteraceae bacterium]|nr:hypothetical protein [Anaeromyxobacteraceae bacterium]
MNATVRRSHEPFRLSVRSGTWRDVAVIVFLTVLLGSFIAHLVAPPSPERAARELRAHAACLADRAAC